MKILNFGSMNIDHVYNVNTFLVAKETAAALGYSKNSGGKGLNQSIALARCGGEIYHAGKIGADGQFLKELLEADRVDTRFIEQDDGPTGHAIIQVDKNGENCILIHGGANREITSEQIDRTLSYFGKNDILLLQNEIAMIPYIIEKASEKGMKIVLNPSPITDELRSYPLDKVSMFILNEIEGAAIGGDGEPDDVIRSILEKYPESEVVLTLGSEGSVYGKKDLRIRQRAYRAKAVDTTAAGDTFTGYLLSSLAAGLDIASALDLASRASAIAVTMLGAARSIPCLETVKNTKFDD